MKKVLFLAIAIFALVSVHDLLACAAVPIDVMPEDDTTPTINCKKHGLLPIAAINACPDGDCGFCDNSLPLLEGTAALRCKIDDADGDYYEDDYTCWWRLSDVVCDAVCDGTISIDYGCGAGVETDYEAINCPS